MAAPVIPPPITARSNSSFCILLRLIFLVFGEKFPLGDLVFSRSMLASQQLCGWKRFQVSVFRFQFFNFFLTPASSITRGKEYGSPLLDTP
jgi:hypothetical protein